MDELLNHLRAIAANLLDISQTRYVKEEGVLMGGVDSRMKKSVKKVIMLGRKQARKEKETCQFPAV